MTNKKDLIIAVLATFCLTATLFMAATSRSADSPNWDPWADINDDKTVDIFDAINLANAFNSYGTTPKNVNVTNWPAAQPSYIYVQGTPINCSWTNTGIFSNYFQTIDVTGFSRAYLYVTSVHLSQASPGTYDVDAQIKWVQWKTSTDPFYPRAYDSEYMDYSGVITDHVKITVFNGQVANVRGQQFDRNWGLDVKGPYLNPVLFYNASVPSGWVMIAIDAYLRNE